MKNRRIRRIGVLACLLFIEVTCSFYEAGKASPVRVVDATGRALELPALPKRLAVVGRGPFMTLHLLYTFPEGRQRLVGIEKKGPAANEFLSLADPAFDSKILLNTNPNAEQIAALHPDLVIMKGTDTDSLSESLEMIGIPTLYLDLETPEAFFRDVANLGIVLGNPKRAEEVSEFYRVRLNRFRQRLAALKESDKPRVLLVEYSDRGNKTAVQVPAKSWMQTIEVQTAGGNPVWFDAVRGTDGYTVVNFEQIALWNPDQLYIIVWYTLDPEKVIRDLKADPQWSELKAIRTGRIYAFPSDIFGWDTAELRWILGMDWLATRMHPVLFGDIDMNAELHAFFGQLFHMDRKSIETGILPRVKMDVR